jgi:beta-fructofuranosidase
MTLALPERWVWDFWFAQEGPDYHIFYLQAPRSLKKEHLRHWHVSIGHATSQDLINWEILPDVLAPSTEDGTWDDYTTWTGSIIKHAGSWFMFYTGSNRAEKGLIQRIGLAISDDLMAWKRHPGNPIIETDPQWYEILDLELWHDQAWRDPWVFQHDGIFHAYITARINHGEKSSRGVIGHATSNDLTQWDVQPPITVPGDFGYLEVPQLVEINGRWYIFFSVTHDKFSMARLNRKGIKHQTGTHYLVADHPLGPFSYLQDDFLVGDEVGSLYSGKVIRNPEGKWVFIAFNLFTHGNYFIGEIIDPFPIQIHPDGRLYISRNEI